MEQEELKVAATGETGDYWGGDARVLANGTFSLKDVPDGTYHLDVSGISQDCYVKTVRYGTSDATQDGFTVHRGNDAALEVTVSSRGARVKGSVADADSLPAAGVWVVLVPEERHRAEFHLYKAKTLDQHGGFELRGIAPGDYKIFSWDRVKSLGRSGISEAIRNEGRESIPARGRRENHQRHRQSDESPRNQAIGKAGCVMRAMQPSVGYFWNCSASWPGIVRSLRRLPELRVRVRQQSALHK